VSALPESGLWSGARIGILGGTFDPPHRGHLEMAAAARARLGLDRVLFSVSPSPPHKQGQPMTGVRERAEMVDVAIHGHDGLARTRIEEPHAPSFTVDLLRACHFRTRADLYFIVGADSLADFPSWREPAEILRLCTLVVFPRDAFPPVLGVPGEAAVVVFESPVIDVSSTELRGRIAAGEHPEGDLPPGVLAYIERHGLYRAAA
jgi:nicotinate-nucleotide adenylyltransferase